MFIPPHYRTLGVQPDASAKEIRSAYRRLAKKYHPDANQGDPRAEELFKRVGIAYQILNDPESRKQYDHIHKDRIELEQLRTASRPHVESEGRNVKINLYVTIEDAVKGGLRQVQYPRDTTCVVCGGTGKSKQNGGLCYSCNGEGIITLEFSTKVSFPVGIRNGETMILIGSGHMGQNMNAGDLAVTVLLKPHPYLEIDGGDLVYHTLIGLDQYIEGGRIRVPVPSGTTMVDVPPRFPDKGVLRKKGRGMPAFKNHQPGDLVVIVEHCLPKKLSRKERIKIDELMGMPGFSPPVDEMGLFPRGVDDDD